jgi:hypothetical protein
MLRNFVYRKRTKSLMAVASQIGFVFSGDKRSLGSRAPQLHTPLFERGHEKIFRNIINSKQQELEGSFFDYSYFQGKNITEQTVATFTQDYWLPSFEITPKNIVSKLRDTILHEDILFESPPGFSKRFRLRSPEEEKIRALLTFELLSYLENLDPKRNWHVEGQGLTLVIYWPGKTIKPNEYVAFVAATTIFARNFFTLSGIKKFEAKRDYLL